MRPCWPLVPVTVIAGSHVTVAQSGLVGKRFLNFLVSQIVRNSYPCGKIKPVSTMFEKFFCATSSHQERCETLPSSWALQEWESGGENTQMILGKCTMPSALRKGGQIPVASAGLSLWERPEGDDCFSHMCMSKTPVK